MRISTSQIYSVANIGMRDAQVAVDQTLAEIMAGLSLDVVVNLKGT